MKITVKVRNPFWIWDKVFKSGLSKFFKGCLPQNLLSSLLNTLSDILNVYPDLCQISK